MKFLFLAAALSLGFGVAIASAEEYSGLTLTQTKAVLGVGQSVNLISLNGKKLKATRSSNVVGVNVYGGNQITLYGKRVGKATVKLCDESFGCETINVKVQKAKDQKFRSAKAKTSVNAGETVSVMTYSGSDVTAYSNSNKLVAYTDGPNVAMRGVSKGKATVTVCSSNRGCLPIFVTINPAKVKKVLGYKTTKEVSFKEAGALPLSKTSVVLDKGQSIDIFGESHALKVSGEAGIVRTAINDNRVTIYGEAAGTTNLNICDPNALCANVYVKVTGGANAFEVSNTKVTVAYGQTIVVKVVGGTTVTAYSDSNWVAAVSVDGDSVKITGGYWSGDTTVHVCNAVNVCKAVTVNVRSSVARGNSGGAKVSGSFSSVVLKVGESKNIYGSNLPSAYNVSNNSNTYVVSANMVSTELLVLKAVGEGTSIITLCPTSKYYSCGTIGVTVVKDENDGVVYDDNAPIKLTETNVVLKRGQTFDVKATTANSLTAVSDTTAVRTAINNNRITLYATMVGEGTVTSCCGNGSCATIKVKVTE